MKKSNSLQKLIAICIVIALSSCSNDSEVWKKYHRLNDGTTAKSAKLHSKYLTLNDNTNSNFKYSSRQASSR